MAISAEPASFMIVFTSAKSRLMTPGLVIRSEMPAIPWRSTSSAIWKASVTVVLGSTMCSRRWFGIVMSASTDSLSIAMLKESVDALITIPNQRLLHMVDPKTTVTEAFQIADDVLRQGIAGISDLITKPGVINLDFADVKTIMNDAGSALMAIGYGEGPDRCVNAAREAIESPLLEMNIQGAKGVLYN